MRYEDIERIQSEVLRPYTGNLPVKWRQQFNYFSWKWGDSHEVRSDEIEIVIKDDIHCLISITLLL